MKITFRRVLGFIGILMAISFGVFVYGGWQMFGDQIRAIRTLKMVKEHVYTFEYKGDYGFKAFLEQGGAKTDIQGPDAGCSTITSGYFSVGILIGNPRAITPS